MPPNQSYEEQSYEEKVKDAKMLSSWFGTSNGSRRSQGKPRPSSGASQRSRGRSVPNARYAVPGRSTGGRSMPCQTAVQTPNINAVPAARASQATQDWLNGASSEREKRSHPTRSEAPKNRADTQRMIDGTVKSSVLDENIVPQKTSQQAPANITSQGFRSESGTKPQQPFQDNASQEFSSQNEKKPQQPSDTSPPKPVQSEQVGIHSTLGDDTPKPTATSTKATLDMEPSPAIDTHQLNGASQLSDSFLTGPVDEDAGKPKRLSVLERYYLREAKRNAQGDIDIPDLMDVDSHPPTPTNGFFDAEDAPPSLPAPLLPFQIQSCSAMSPIKEGDLLQFTDTLEDEDFGVLIPSPAESPAEKGSSKTANKNTNPMPKAETVNAFMTEDSVKATLTVSIEMNLKDAAEAQASNFANTENLLKAQGLSRSKWAAAVSRHNGQSSAFTIDSTTTITNKQCDCNAIEPAKAVRGLSSSKWANPRYQHQDQFSLDTGTLSHEVGCPVKTSCEKKHPLESGANPATYEPKQRQHPEIELVWPPKLKRLNPDALPFFPRDDCSRDD